MVYINNITISLFYKERQQWSHGKVFWGVGGAENSVKSETYPWGSWKEIGRNLRGAQ